MNIQNGDLHKTSVKTSLTQAAEVRYQLEILARAVRHGLLAEIMSFYSPAVVAFGVNLPFKFTNLESYRQGAWIKGFIEAFHFPISYEYREDQLFVTDEFAIRTGEIHVSGVYKKTVERADFNLRNTTLMQSVDGEWKIIHEHSSVPLGNESKVLLNLKSNQQIH